MNTPYAAFPSSAFWKTVSDSGPLGIQGIYQAKFDIRVEDRIATAGSCFAQHIGRRLRESGFGYADVEPPPSLLPREQHGRFGFGIFSARYGNIYTARQLHQLALRALGKFSPEEDHWCSGGRYYDCFRPFIEPNGFASLEELRADRDSHLRAVQRLLKNTDIFVFTFGLTEAWASVADGAVYPICPGTRGVGSFDEKRHRFINMSYRDVFDDMQAFIGTARELNPDMKFFLTVSPVPLTATASGQHVLTATTYSKSVLRAVAGQLASSDDRVSYFPSFELISAPISRGMFYEPDMRNVHQAGVDHVMRHFFASHPPPKKLKPKAEKKTIDSSELVCEEMLLAEDAA